jgi:hypothetical protein
MSSAASALSEVSTMNLLRNYTYAIVGATLSSPRDSYRVEAGVGDGLG